MLENPLINLLNIPPPVASKPSEKDGEASSVDPDQGDSGLEDLELVGRCQKGDTQAFNELVTRHRGKIYIMIYHMVHNEQDAWDLAQEGFFKAWKSLGQFRGQSSFYTWLYRISMNLSLDWLRKRQIQGGVEFNDGLELNIEPGAATAPCSTVAPREKMERDEVRVRINEAIERLSPEHRAAILMREVEGMPYEEIAAAQKCSLGTVMSRLFYARKKLQTMLKDLYDNR
jgi:RNA polymerase sigma-70 factor (ECF subfamily)